MVYYSPNKQLIEKTLTANKGSVSKGKTKPLASLKRTMEFWDSLWGKFDDAMGELGDEDGKYAVQDHHWESPYFDGSSLADDLEPIAKDMLKLIEDVYDEVNDPNLFLNSMQEMDDQIHHYPEWMRINSGGKNHRTRDEREPPIGLSAVNNASIRIATP